MVRKKRLDNVEIFCGIVKYVRIEMVYSGIGGEGLIGGKGWRRWVLDKVFGDGAGVGGGVVGELNGCGGRGGYGEFGGCEVRCVKGVEDYYKEGGVGCGV
ncbi:hypothetical protein Tco_0319751 [Tanacetum coccineum]